MPAFICKGSAELQGTGNKRKIQNEDTLYMSPPRIEYFYVIDTLDRSAIGTEVFLCLKLLQYSEVTGNMGVWPLKTGKINRRRYDVSKWLWLYMYWNRLSDIIYISFTLLITAYKTLYESNVNIMPYVIHDRILKEL